MEDRNKLTMNLLNGTYLSLKTIAPIRLVMQKPRLLEQSFYCPLGFLIGMTDIKGKLILSGDPSIFHYIGESMFGMSMPLEREMLLSFSGKLRNMISRELSTYLIESGINTDITSSTIIQGNFLLLGYQKVLQMTAIFENEGELDVCLLL